MKTVLNRALSLVMCLILICSTMSVTAFGANAAEDFDYKTYAQNATKENVHYLMDLLDDVLKKENIILKVDELSIVIDLTSIDAICSTLDDFRTAIKLGKYLLGDLKELELDVFDKGMSRAKSGDYKIFSEILQLAAANTELIELLFSDEGLDLGVVGTVAKLDNVKLDISTTLKEVIVDAVYNEGDANYAAAKNRAMTDFDAFVYTDLIGLLSKPGGALEGIEVDADTTIDHLITDVFNILVSKHLVGLVKDETFRFADLDVDDTTNYAVLDTIIEIDGDYDFTGIEFTKAQPVIKQINDVLGKVFKQLVPAYTGWTSGDYTKIGDNVRKLVRYIAEKSGLIENVGSKSDEALMVEIIKIIFYAADTNGVKEVYEAIKNTTTLTDMANKIVIHLSGKSYPAGTTYEQVAGDFIIEEVGDTIPLYDAKGNTLTANGKNTVWDVLNSLLNFFLVDKNLNDLYGMNVKKSDSYFAKLDIILDFTANDGSADFSSKEYITSLVNSILTVDLQKFINLTAVKALNFAGDVSVTDFLCNTVNNLLRNWSESSVALDKWDEFDDMLSNDGIANLVKVVLETLNNRSNGTACFVGLIVNFLTDVSEKVESKDSTCTATGYKATKTCLKCNRVYLKGATVAAKGHKYDSGKITKKPTCTAPGTRLYTCTVCKATKTAAVSALGHKKTGWTVKKKATYTAAGEKIRTCTVCKAVTDKRSISRLTLSKPSGLKASAVSTSSIKFSWKKVTGAESYVLYYKTGSGKWKTVKTKKTSATVKKLKTGTTYKFKVVAVAGKYKSKDSSTVSGTTKPATVSLKDLRSKKKKEIIAEWKKISGVTGYEVMYSTSKKFTKKTTKTVTIKKQSTYKTIIKKLKSKKKYYVKVRAYKTVNKVKVYGSYSKVKSIKCK